MKQFRKTLAESLQLVFFLFFISSTLMLLVTVLVSVYMNRMEKTMEDSIQNHLVSAAKAAAVFLTVEELDLFHSGDDMEKPEWEAVRARLKQFAKDHNVLYVYYWRYHSHDRQIQYIIDNDEDEEWMVTPELFFSLTDDPLTAEAVPLIMSGNAWVSDLGAYTASWDGLISSVAPVFNADGLVYCAAGVDLSDEIILAQRSNIRILRLVLIFSLVLSVLSGFIGMLLYRRKAYQSEAANRAKSRFLSTMSHEIRTPLNAVIGLSDILLRSKIPQDSRDYIQQIRQSGSSLLGIINDILDISKIEAGSFDLIPTEYEIPSFINDTVNQNIVRIGAKPITFTLEINGDFPRRLRGDELRIKQILNNILSNAIKYTRRGNVTLSAAWENLPNVRGNEILIHFIVRDTGIGIRKEEMNKLFSDYVQLNSKSHRMIEGTGLGLAITKKLVDMMDGNITVESEYGKGSVFTVTLVQVLVDPLSIGEETAERLKQFEYVEPEKRKETAHSWMPYGKVLVVDDVEINLLVVQGLLEPYGLQIDTALSGNEAVEMVQAEEIGYDLIFMDHMMPGMDGIEAVRIIREWEEKQGKDRIPIVALTANALVGNKEMFLSKGFDGFVPKPIDPAEIDEVLNKWVQNKE